jgi:hypothetical protein
MTDAPILCSNYHGSHALCASGVPPVLHGAYALWQEHHASCSHCHAQDWFMPGGIRFLTEDDALLADGKLVVKGETLLYRRSPDLSVLCPAGAALFKQWVQQATKHRPPKTVSGGG